MDHKYYVLLARNTVTNVTHCQSSMCEIETLLLRSFLSSLIDDITPKYLRPCRRHKITPERNKMEQNKASNSWNSKTFYKIHCAAHCLRSGYFYISATDNKAAFSAAWDRDHTICEYFHPALLAICAFNSANDFKSNTIYTPLFYTGFNIGIWHRYRYVVVCSYI